MLNVTLEINGQKVSASAPQAAALNTLIQTNKGGFARVHGYVAKTGYTKPEVADVSFLSRFSQEKLNARREAAIKALTFKDVAKDVRKSPKVKGWTDTQLQTAFKDRQAFLLESLAKTASGDRSDSRRQAHDRCYAKIGDGVKVHFKTAEGADGLKYPVLNAEGLPQVESIMVSAIEVSRNVIQKGIRKPVNSGVPVIISNAMEKKLPKATKVRMFSLKEDNFTKLTIDGNAILPPDIAGDFT